MGGARGRALARPGRRGRGRGGGLVGDAGGARRAADRRPRRRSAGRVTEELAPGGSVGAGGEPVDLALDPLEGGGVVARGGTGAMAMIAVGDRLAAPPARHVHAHDGGRAAREDAIDLRRPVAENIEAIAESFGRQAGDITTIVLDRPRHHDLIEDIRAAGARIKLIQDGTVTASITAAIRGTNDHLAIGIGGTRQAVLVRGRAPLPRRRLAGRSSGRRRGARSRRRSENGIEDVAHVFHEEDLAPGDVIVVATGRLERRPPARRPLPRRQRADALARHVHALQLGALRRRDPLLRPRAARGRSGCCI